MSSAELKVEIFRKIDRLDDAYLIKIYKYISELLDQNVQSDEWDSLSISQKKGLIDAVDFLKEGKSVPHDQVISTFKDRYRNA